MSPTQPPTQPPTQAPPTATGRLTRRTGIPLLEFERTFRAPIDDVWDAVTEPERLERWIGTWTGDPATGRVTFRMTAEGDDVPDETIWVDVCERPTRLVMRSMPPGEDAPWRWELTLAESDGVTTLTFAQEVTGAELALSVGPGWDYYLDRLVAAETGADVSAVDFADYEPALSEHYRRELRDGGLEV
jgi:uncharacterized protein YndB with AHSA1/START domain